MVTPSVIVLDGETRASLAVARSLGRRGYPVHVGSSVPKSIAGGSRYSLSETLLPDPMTGAMAYATAVAELTAARRARVVLPTTEASTLALLEQRRLFSNALIPTSGFDIFERACDKSAVLALAGRLGIDVPSQWTRSGEPGESSDIPRDAFPVVVKPVRSVIGLDGERRKVGVTYADSPEDLAKLLKRQGPEAGPYLIQTRVEGPGLGVFLLRWGGHVLASFAHRRIREKPPSGGVSVLCESVPAPPALLTQSEALLRALDWTGVAMVEYKRDTRSGRTYLMEVNPRFWGSLQLAVDAGVDFPHYLVQAALGESFQPVTKWRLGVRSRWGWGDIDHLLIRLLHSRAKLALPSDAPSLFRTALSVLLPWRPGQRSDVFRLTDPAPWLRETHAWVRGA
jgi:predicted ATP-grasp superfamily ATP-dependent carboligase